MIFDEIWYSAKAIIPWQQSSVASWAIPGSRTVVCEHTNPTTQTAAAQGNHRKELEHQKQKEGRPKWQKTHHVHISGPSNSGATNLDGTSSGEVGHLRVWMVCTLCQELHSETMGPHLEVAKNTWKNVEEWKISLAWQESKRTFKFSKDGFSSLGQHICQKNVDISAALGRVQQQVVASWKQSNGPDDQEVSFSFAIKVSSTSGHGTKRLGGGTSTVSQQQLMVSVLVILVCPTPGFVQTFSATAPK